MNITHIAVVDDFQKDRAALASKITDYMTEYDLKYVLHEYDSAEAFLAALPTMDLDIVFMDIYMSGMTGVDAAARLRACDRDCKLVFLTSSEAYLRQALSLSSSDYLSKPLEDADFRRAMANCRVKPEYDIPVLTVPVGSETLTIETGRIVYIDFCDRSTRIHLNGDIISTGMPFSKVCEPLLSDRRFLPCIKGILVNMDKVQCPEGDCFRMKNGDLLPINMRSRKSLLEAYQTYLFKRMRGVI